MKAFLYYCPDNLELFHSHYVRSLNPELFELFTLRKIQPVTRVWSGDSTLFAGLPVKRLPRSLVLVRSCINMHDFSARKHIARYCAEHGFIPYYDNKVLSTNGYNGRNLLEVIEERIAELFKKPSPLQHA